MLSYLINKHNNYFLSKVFYVLEDDNALIILFCYNFS